MKKIERIAQWENGCKYCIDQIENEDITRILLLNADQHPNGVISLIEYPTMDTYSSSLLNWENLIRCSNYYGLPPEEIRLDGSLGYMSVAVQQHLKPASTIRMTIDDPHIKQLKMDLPDDCVLLKYEEENTTFICRKSSLSDLFDIERVRETYVQFGILDIDWDVVYDYSKKEMTFFADNAISGISIERGSSNNTQHVIVGLLLGYPIESTVAKMKGTYRVEDPVIKCQARMHYKKNTEPFRDSYKDVWMNQGGTIFASWQQEKLYY